MPFLRNVTRGRNVPESRLEEVAEHYLSRGGRSPINDQNRALVASLQSALRRDGLELNVYWGNRNWHPLLDETVAQMQRDGVRRALAFVTSAFGSYSGCRQYQQDIATAAAACSDAPEIHKLRLFYNHPGFIQPMAEGVRDALGRLASEATAGQARLVFSAHSIPEVMATGAPYQRQLAEAASLIAERCVPTNWPGEPPAWDLVYQSRSGPPQVPWLEPDVVDHLAALAADGVTEVVLVPLGFVSDHMEVIHDLDEEAAEAAAALGIRLIRSATVGTHPAYIQMIVELIRERLDPTRPRQSLGSAGTWPDFCAAECCPQGQGATSPPNPARRSG